MKEHALLHGIMTWIKRSVLTYTLKMVISKEERKWIKTHNKKRHGLISRKKEINRINENPNSIITNLSSKTITKEEYNILSYGLNHGIAVSAKQNDILASSEALRDQLEQSKCLKENFTSIQRVKNAIRAMSFSLSGMDSKRLTKDKNKINILNNLLKDVVLLTPDKSNGIVLVDCLDYKNSVKQMFSDRTKFRKINEDPAFRSLSSLQQYLRKLKERNELSEEIYQRIQPQNGRLGRAHGLPKIHKEFVDLPKFGPIVDTTGTVHYHVGKYLSELLNPLTSNEYTIKDSFDALTLIKNIPQELFDRRLYICII